MTRRTFSALLAAGLLPAADRAPEEDTAWVCPMHADYTMDVAGKCPRCGMDLVHAAPFDVRDYDLDFHTEPAAIKPNQKVKLFFRFRHPGTGEVVKKFEVVHERQFHLDERDGSIPCSPPAPEAQALSIPRATFQHCNLW